jgi:hypothetical protein
MIFAGSRASPNLSEVEVGSNRGSPADAMQSDLVGLFREPRRSLIAN